MPFGFEQHHETRFDIALSEIFGVRSFEQLGDDLFTVLGKFGNGFQLDSSSLGHLKPEISLPAYLGYIPENRLSPIVNLFDRVGGGKQYSQRVTRRYSQDFRGRKLTYDDHDGTDFVCPLGVPVVSAAPGVITLVRDRWLRGGLTVTIDHGAGVSTQYSHLSRVLRPVGHRVSRGELVALSGASGIDMTAFFPWVPPHVHFMVWLDGRPVDPFLNDVEEERTGSWQKRNQPLPAETAETEFEEPQVNEKDLLRAAEFCIDNQIRNEVYRAKSNVLSLAALLEDSFHHDPWAWPNESKEAVIRKKSTTQVRLSLPFEKHLFTGSCFSDEEI